MSPNQTIAFELAGLYATVTPTAQASIAGTVQVGTSSDTDATPADVLVTANHDLFAFSLAGAISVGKDLSAAPAVNWTHVELTTTAGIDDGAQVESLFGDVRVVAEASEDLVLLAIAGSGFTSSIDLDFSGINLSLGNQTTASIGAATVTAGGNVLVGAFDDTSVFTLAGGLALGTGPGSLGAGGILVDINKTTEASIAVSATVDAAAKGVNTVAVLNGGMSDKDFDTETLVGVAVQAQSRETIIEVELAELQLMD